MVGAFDALQIAGLHFEGQEVGHFGFGGFGMIVYAQGAGHYKAGVAVEVDVAFHAEYAYAQLTGAVDGVVQQLQAIALPLVVGVYADGAEGPGGEHAAVGLDDLCLGEHDVAYDTAFVFHH